MSFSGSSRSARERTRHRPCLPLTSSMQASGAAPASPATLALAVAAFILLLLALLFSRYAIDAILLLFERRRVLEPDERARLALAAPYARLWHMPDSDLAGLPPRRRQRVWNVLAGDW